MEGLNQFAAGIHKWAREQGFYDKEVITCSCRHERTDVLNPSLLPEKLALMHSELSEALEAWRDDNDSEIDEELVDVLIRVLDTLVWRGVNIEGLLEYKMSKNRGRPYMHGRKRG